MAERKAVTKHLARRYERASKKERIYRIHYFGLRLIELGTSHK